MDKVEKNLLEQLPLYNIPGILMGLYYDGVITKKEQLVINSQFESVEKISRVFHILKKTDARISDRILKKTGNERFLEFINGPPSTTVTKVKNLKLCNQDEDSAKNPMLLDLVLKRMFMNLRLKDLKNCRLVCRKWNFVAEPIIRVKGRIEYNIASHKTSEEFSTLFSNAQTFVPFKAFRLTITQERNYPIDVKPMETFFNENGKYLTELMMYHVNFLGDKISEELPRQLMPRFDMNPLMKIATNLVELNVMNIKRYDTSVGLTQLTFSSNHLVSLKKLDLINCTIKIVRGVCLNATEINLYDVTFSSSDDQDLEEVLLNDFLNFKRVRKVQIHLWTYCNVKLSLDFAKETITHLDYLDVYRCEFLNWEKASGEIDNFILSSSLFNQQPVNMRVKQMLIDDLPFVNLCSIPESIEKLCIKNADVLWSFANTFAYLKHLQLYNNHIQNLFYFKCCPQLVSVELRYRTDWSIEIKMDWVPLNVKNIWLKGNIKISGQKTLEVETLIADQVMCNYFTKKIFGRCKKSFSALKFFKAKRIIISDSEYLIKSKTEFLALPAQLIVIGPFDWDILRFSTMSKFVDRKAKYYVFQKQRGRAIDQKTFAEYMKL